MQDLNDKVNNGGATAAGQLSADEWNQLPTEIQNVIEALGQVLSGSDLNQLGKSIAGYVANGTFYTDSGAANAYVLTGIGSKQSAPAYTDGFEAEFIAGSTNTGASTVNIAGLGVKNIKTSAGADPAAGDIDGRTKIKYDLANDWFEIVLADASETVKGIIELATDAETAAGTDAVRAIVPSALASLFGASSQAGNGYARIPVKIGGAIDELIVQWGFSTATNAGTTIAYPIAFPNAVFNVDTGSASVTMFVSATTLTTTNFSFRSNTGSSLHYWIAIGH